MTNTALLTFRFPEGTCIAQAQPAPATPASMESPAIEVLTDLSVVIAATVHPHMLLAQAESKMVKDGVRMLFVVADMPCLNNIVTV